jgi:hypothetical protein
MPERLPASTTLAQPLDLGPRDALGIIGSGPGGEGAAVPARPRWRVPLVTSDPATNRTVTTTPASAVRPR